MTAFEPEGDLLRMEPAAARQVQQQKTWRYHYMRRDSTTLWIGFNRCLESGCIAKEGHLFLLVTLEKGSLNKNTLRRPLLIGGFNGKAKENKTAR
jgi:hypothetical protein